MKYQTLIPITHNGQVLPVGLVFSDSDAFGKKEKSPLQIEPLLAKRRISPVAVLSSEPPKTEGETGRAEDKGKK